MESTPYGNFNNVNHIGLMNTILNDSTLNTDKLNNDNGLKYDNSFYEEVNSGNIVNNNVIDIMSRSSCNAMLSTSPMVKMNTLDSAEVRSEHCPICRSMNPLKHIDGFLVCNRCGTNFKTWNNNVYIIDYVPSELTEMSLNEIIMHNDKFRR